MFYYTQNCDYTFFSLIFNYLNSLKKGIIMKLLKFVIFAIFIFCSTGTTSYASQSMGTGEWIVSGLYMGDLYITELSLDIEAGKKYFLFSGIVDAETSSWPVTGSGFITSSGGASIGLYVIGSYLHLTLFPGLDGEIKFYNPLGTLQDSGTVIFQGIH